MSAFYDLKQRGDTKYKKHRRDILKLALLLTGNEEIILVGRMKEDFDTFLAHLEQDVDSKMLKSIVDKLPVEKEQIIEILQRVFKSWDFRINKSCLSLFFLMDTTDILEIFLQFGKKKDENSNYISLKLKPLKGFFDKRR